MVLGVNERGTIENLRMGVAVVGLASSWRGLPKWSIVALSRELSWFYKNLGAILCWEGRLVGLNYPNATGDYRKLIKPMPYPCLVTRKSYEEFLHQIVNPIYGLWPEGDPVPCCLI